MGSRGPLGPDLTIPIESIVRSNLSGPNFEFTVCPVPLAPELDGYSYSVVTNTR